MPVLCIMQTMQMKKVAFATAVILGLGFSVCSSLSYAQSQKTQATKTTKTMKNLVSIVEIPVTDFSRAVTFYQAILDIKIEAMDMDGVQMGVLPNEEGAVNVVLAK